MSVTEDTSSMTNVGHIGPDTSNPSVHYRVYWLVPAPTQLAKCGKDVFSPTFCARIDGYCFRLCMKWSGMKKENLGVFLQLYRETNYCGTLRQFNHEYSFKVHSTKEHTVDGDWVAGNCEKCVTETIT